MSNGLVFYTNPMSRGRIIRWMLEETGVPYETKIMEYGKDTKSAEYLALNPMGKLPTLKHGDNIITESAAICAYLADTFPAANLAPKSDSERSRYYRWLFFCAGPLEQAIGFTTIGATISEEQSRFLGCGNPKTTIEALAGAVRENQYITGDRFTAADVYVGSHLGFGMQFGGLEHKPEFVSYVERLNQRPARQKATAIDDALMPKK